uniref:Uncharacterized protein n=1 Tax=Anguilla anguilla TaxID=7936 RepID=A0A0E9SF78_ANGAN
MVTRQREELTRKSEEGILESSIHKQKSHLEKNSNRILRTAYMVVKKKAISLIA